MTKILSIYWNVLTLAKEPFVSLKDREDSFWFALRFFLIIALLASFSSLLAFGSLSKEPALSSRLQQTATDIQNRIDRLPPMLRGPFQEIPTALDKVAGGLAEYQPPLGRTPSLAIHLVGQWLTIPLELLSAWMSSALAIWLIARLLGGQGSLRQHFSLLLLAFAPQLLTFLNYLPPEITPSSLLSGVLNMVAWIWSLAIAVHALKIAHGFQSDKAVFSLLLTFFITVLLIPALLILLSGILAILAWKLIF
jgi:hypothetical protein